MINFSLYAKDAKQKGHITIYLRINKASEKIRISTRITVPEKNWNQTAQMVVKGGDFDLAFYREKLSKTVAAVEVKEEPIVIKTELVEDRQITVEAKACDRFIYDEEVKKVVSVAREGALFG